MARLLVVAGAALLLGTSCSSSEAWKTFRDQGISVNYPANWYATRRPLTPVTSPIQVLAVASYRLPAGNEGANGCSPKEALDRLPSSGVFLFGWEYDRPGLSGVRKSDFPPRPHEFTLGRRIGFECLGPSYVIHFREAGRLFQIHVVLGPKAGDSQRKTALQILESFSARPS
jgi:hypothetical protein